MLVLRRKDGQWIEITHRSGDVIRFRVYELSGEGGGRALLAFDDAERNFAVERPERLTSRHAGSPQPIKAIHAVPNPGGPVAICGPESRRPQVV